MDTPGPQRLFFAKNRIELHFGSASLVDRHTVDVRLPDGAAERLTTKNVVIATGSRPYRPGQVDFDHPAVFDSDTILRMPHTPRRLLIFGAGVIGFPSLASAAYDQGRATAAAARGKPNPRPVDDTPTGIYTLPEISSVGATAKELTSAKVPDEVGRALFKETARAQISGEDVGVLNILFHIDTLAILGVHCFGAEATEIVHIGQAIMKQQGEANSIRYFVSTTFNYPTMAEAYRIAALNGLNRLTRY